MMGDLKRGRTVRSLCYLMKNYRDVKLVFIAPEQFAMEDDVKAYLSKHSISFVETRHLEDVLPEVNALYVTRMQSEWDSAEESHAVDLEHFSVGAKELSLLASDSIVMHPLPRGPELDPAVDADPRAMYWRQERNGMWMRVAVLLKIFQLESRVQHTDPEAFTDGGPSS